jgi:hypothetical protein
VLVDEPITHLMSCKCVDAERRDAEVEPDGARKDAAVIDLVDLVNPRHRVTAHSAVLLQVVWGHLATQLNERPGTDRPPRRATPDSTKPPRVALAIYAGVTDDARAVAVDKLVSAGFGA